MYISNVYQQCEKQSRNKLWPLSSSLAAGFVETSFGMYWIRITSKIILKKKTAWYECGEQEHFQSCSHIDVPNQ